MEMNDPRSSAKSAVAVAKAATIIEPKARVPEIASGLTCILTAGN
jgi:hypothetical protein